MKKWDCLLVDDVSPKANKYFKDTVYIGDQLTHVNNVEVNSIGDVVKLAQEAAYGGSMANVTLRMRANNFRDNQYHADDTSWAKCFNTWRKAHDVIARIICFPMVLCLFIFAGGLAD